MRSQPGRPRALAAVLGGGTGGGLARSVGDDPACALLAGVIPRASMRHAKSRASRAPVVSVWPRSRSPKTAPAIRQQARSARPAQALGCLSGVSVCRTLLAAPAILTATLRPALERRSAV